MSSTPILVWGAGAIGGVIGAHVARSGRPVTFVDTDAEHVSRIATTGLEIYGPVTQFIARAEAVTPDRVEGTFDIVLLAVKSQHTSAALAQIEPHLAADGVVVSCQNGLNELVVAEVLGAQKTIGCMVSLPSDRVAPGNIVYGRLGHLAIGTLDGKPTGKLDDVAAALRAFDPGIVVTPHIMDYLWSKMSFVGLLAAATVTGETTPDFVADPSLRKSWVGAVSEIMAVAATDGLKPVAFEGFDPGACVSADPVRIQAVVDRYLENSKGSPKQYSGFWRDIVVLKRKTEFPAQIAPVLAKAQNAGVSTPVLRLLADMIARIDNGEASMGPEMAARLRSL